jgi:hypothetical protein
LYPNFFFYWKQFKFGMPWRKLVLKSNVNYHWISFIYFQAFSKWRGCNITLFVLLWFFVEVTLIFIFSSILCFINFSFDLNKNLFRLLRSLKFFNLFFSRKFSVLFGGWRCWREPEQSRVRSYATQLRSLRWRKMRQLRSQTQR